MPRPPQLPQILRPVSRSSTRIDTLRPRGALVIRRGRRFLILESSAAVDFTAGTFRNDGTSCATPGQGGTRAGTVLVAGVEGTAVVEGAEVAGAISAAVMNATIPKTGAKRSL